MLSRSSSPPRSAGESPPPASSPAARDAATDWRFFLAPAETRTRFPMRKNMNIQAKKYENVIAFRLLEHCSMGPLPATRASSMNPL